MEINIVIKYGDGLISEYRLVFCDASVTVNSIQTNRTSGIFV
jgi:hypothetical protein